MGDLAKSPRFGPSDLGLWWCTSSLVLKRIVDQSPRWNYSKVGVSDIMSSWTRQLEDLPSECKLGLGYWMSCTDGMRT